MSDPTLKELKKDKIELEKKIEELAEAFQAKFRVEIKDVSLDHRRRGDVLQPYSTKVSIDVKLI